jgi:ribosomal protein S18 acetylase RimI-like enzyme
MAEVRAAEEKDLEEMARVLVPAFSDKALAILGDEEKARKLVPYLLQATEGLKLIGMEDGKAVGAILVSVREIELPNELFKMLRKELGFFKALKAVRLVRNYERSLPKREDKEARLEAVGVVEGLRDKGIGTELINIAEDKLKAQGIEYFCLSVKTSNPAVGLYSRLGFEKISSFTNALGDWIYMRKALGSHP